MFSFFHFSCHATIVCLQSVEPHILWNHVLGKQVFYVNKKQALLQILGLIENMSFFKCLKCGEWCDVFGHSGAQSTAQEMDMEFLGEVPNNPHSTVSPCMLLHFEQMHNTWKHQ
jgi:hypothetical protein